MATQASTAELVAALYRAAGKAEIVGGEIVVMSLRVASTVVPRATYC